MGRGCAVMSMLVVTGSRVTVYYGQVLDSLLYSHQMPVLCLGLHKKQPF